MDRMRGIQSSACKVLAVLIFIGVIAAGMISLQRTHIESAATSVENVYDYYNIIDSASVEKNQQMSCFRCTEKAASHRWLCMTKHRKNW